MLKLKDKNKKLIAGLINYKDLCIESTLSTGDKKLSFSLHKEDKFYNLIEEECYIETKTQEYVIKARDVGVDYTRFDCVLNLEELEANIFDRFESVEQTITASLNLAIVGTGWTVKDNTLKKKRTVRCTNKNALEIVQEIKKTYRVDIVFNTLEKQIEVYEHLGQDKGTYFIDSLNLTALQVQSDSYKFATRIVAEGKDGLTFEDINNGKNYVENYQYSNKVKTIYWKDERYTIKESLLEDAKAKLKEISKPYVSYNASILNLAELNPKYKNILDYRLGDTITLLSKNNKIKDKQRIVKTIEWPQDHTKDTVELANATLKFEDIQQENQETTDTVNNITVDNGTVDGSTIDSITTKQIEDFKANVVEVVNLKAINASIDNLHANKADIQDLHAVTAKIGTLEATKANITQLNAVNAEISKLNSIKANIVDLNAASGKINVLESKTASIDNLLAGNLTANNFKANSIVAGSAIIAENAIGSSQISSLTANKITTGTIDTSLVTVAGPNGRLKILGNRLQIFDDVNNRLFERIMLGINDKNRACLTLRATDGQTVLLTEEGLTKAGITDGFGKADDNSLSALKLDKNSIVRQVNGATETIAGTRIQVGDRTLDVELSTQKNTITEHGKELSNQKATINALDNAIKLKVDNQTFTQSTSTINNNINNLNSDLVSKINSSLSTAKSYSDTKKQEAINSSNSHADAKANESLNNAKAYTNAQVITVNSNLSKATSEINILKNQISTKVSQSDIDKTVNNIQIGGRNLLTNELINKFEGKGYSKNTDGSYNLISANSVSYFQNDYILENQLGGEEFTFSVEIKHLSGNISRNFRITVWHDGDWDNFYISDLITKNFMRFSKTVKLKNTSRIGLCIQIDDTDQVGNTFVFRHLKLEKGNKATDWIPAPEDTDKLIADNIKVVTDKINDVSTKFIQAKDSLQASVNSLNSTTQTITTNLTKTNNDLSNKINIAKNDAINSSKSYADIKKNEAISSANAHADSKANDVKNQAINSANAYTNAQITTVNTRVSNTESSINVLKNQILTKVGQSDIDKTVDNIQIGVRNLLTSNIINKFYGSAIKNEDGSYTLISSNSASYFQNDIVLESQEKDSEFTFSVDIKHLSGNISRNVRITVWHDGYWDDYYISDLITSNFKRFSKTIKLKGNSKIGLCIQIDDTDQVGNTFIFRHLKLEKGNKATDWTSAPEDINQEIKDNITTVTTKISNVESNLKQTKDSLQASVESVSVKTNNVSNSLNATKNDLLNKLNSAIDTSKKYADQVAIAKADLARQQAIASADGKITSEEKKRIQQAQDNLNIALNKADKAKAEAVNLSKQYANTQLEVAKNYTNGQVSSAKSELNITLNGISQKVTDNTNRLSNAESKITPTAIINSVNNSIGSGGVIKGASTILDKNKFTVMDTDNSKIEMQKGAITAYNNSGKKTYYLDDGELGVCAKDNSDPLGILTSVYKITATNDRLGNNQSFTTPPVANPFKGIGLLAGDYAGYLTLGYDDIWGNDTHYVEFFRCHKAGWMHMGTSLNFSNEYSIRNIKEINRGNVAELYLNQMNFDLNSINTNSTKNKDLWLNYGLGYDCWKANATNDVNVRIGNGNNNGSHGNLVCQSLWVHGNKHRIVDCGDLGFIGMEAYETSIPYFGDIGNAKINEDGICYIIFDREFMEVCDTRTNYKVDISIVSEDLNSKVQVAKKFEDKVKIIGTPGTEFDYEIKAVQKGVDIKRFKRIDEKRSDKTNYSINDDVKKLTSKYNNEINPDDGLMKDIELQRSFNLKRTINQLDKKTNKAYDILSYIEGRFN